MRLRSKVSVLSLGLLLAAGCSQSGSVSTDHVRAAPETTIAAPPATQEKGDPHALELAMVLGVGATTYVSFGSESLMDEDAWGVGEPRLVETGAYYVARRSVDVAAMPEEIRSQRGKKVRLFDDRGLRCEALLGDFALIVRADPRMDTRDEWEGKGYSGKATKATPSEIAADVWTMNAPLLVATVQPLSGTCAGANIARSSSLSSPTVAAADPADAATTARVIAFARTTPTFVAIQTGFAAEAPIPGEPPRPARWEDMPYTSTSVVMMRTGSSTYVWVTVATEGGCGDFNARYGALLREDASAKGGFTIVTAPEGGVDQSPRALIDLGDGAPTMSFGDSLLRPDAGAYRYESNVVYSMECPC